MQQFKLLSVLIPTYNRAEFLFYSLKALTQQTFKDFKVIIYDDGSDDNTSDIVNCFRSKLEVEYITSEKNHGVGYARNKLLEMVDTPYFAWQDSDDISQPDRFEKQINEIQKVSGNCACFAYAFFFRHPNRNRRHLHQIDVSKYTSRAGLAKNMCFASGMFSSDIASQTFNPRLKKKEDLDWLTKLIKSKVNFVCVPEPLYYIRQHDGRLTKHESRDTQ